MLRRWLLRFNQWKCSHAFSALGSAPVSVWTPYDTFVPGVGIRPAANRAVRVTFHCCHCGKSVVVQGAENQVAGQPALITYDTRPLVHG